MDHNDLVAMSQYVNRINGRTNTLTIPSDRYTAKDFDTTLDTFGRDRLKGISFGLHHDPNLTTLNYTDDATQNAEALHALLTA